MTAALTLSIHHDVLLNQIKGKKASFSPAFPHSSARRVTSLNFCRTSFFKALKRIPHVVRYRKSPKQKGERQQLETARILGNLKSLGNIYHCDPWKAIRRRYYFSILSLIPVYEGGANTISLELEKAILKAFAIHCAREIEESGKLFAEVAVDDVAQQSQNSIRLLLRAPLAPIKLFRLFNSKSFMKFSSKRRAFRF